MAAWSLPFLDRAQAAGTFGVVAASHKLAAQTAMGVLERGGNAFDAVVAAGFVFQVVEPHMDGLGGELVALLCRKDDDRPTVVCGQGVAPAGASIAKFRALGRKLIPSSGLLPAVVPGAFGAWMLLLRDYGTINLADALAPAIHYAEHGFPVSPEVSREIAKSSKVFNTRWPASAECYLPGGSVPPAGSIIRNPGLARTYRNIVTASHAQSPDRDTQIELAREYFYCGPIAEAVDRFARSRVVLDEEGKPEECFLTAADMSAWRATYEPPVSIDWHGHRIFKSGFWSQSPVLLQFLQMMDADEIADGDAVGGELTHLQIEIAKLVFADREAWYGDSGRGADGLQVLLTPEYARQRRRLITDFASDLLRPGSIDVHAPSRLSAGPYDRGPLKPRIAENAGPADGDTSHINIVDCWGNMVSATPSGGWLQGSPIIPGLGFSLSTRGQMFWLDEASPSRLEPGKRPRTTLSPTMAIARDGSARLAFGSKGADFADQWAVQFAVRHFVHKLPLQAAMDAPMFGSEHWPSSVYPRRAQVGTVQLDPRYPETTRRDLEGRGHNVKLAEVHRQGRNCAVWTDGHLKIGAASLRMANAAAVGR